METLGVFAYSYRIDMSHCEWNEKELVKYVTHPDVKAYMFAREFKPQGNIPHYQGIIWFETERTEKEMVHYRNFNKKKFVRKSKGRGDGAVSFTRCKMIGSLSKYCNDKEGFGLIKTRNITSKMLKELGKWKDNKKLRKKKLEIVEQFKETFKSRYSQMTIPLCRGSKYIYDDSIMSDYQCGRELLKSMMCEIAYDTFINTDFNPPMYRHIPNILKSILHKHDYISIVYHVQLKNDDLEEIEPYESS